MSEPIVSQLAERDMELIWERIAEDNPDAADRVQDAFESAIEKLGRMPNIGHPRPDVLDPRYRFYRVYSYIIAYFFEAQPAEIAR